MPLLFPEVNSMNRVVLVGYVKTRPEKFRFKMNECYLFQVSTYDVSYGVNDEDRREVIHNVVAVGKHSMAVALEEGLLVSVMGRLKLFTPSVVHPSKDSHPTYAVYTNEIQRLLQSHEINQLFKRG